MLKSVFEQEKRFITFIFIELSETPNSFMKIHLALEIRNVVSLIKGHTC